MASQVESRSLKATYLAAERQREAIERGSFYPGTASAASTPSEDNVGTPTSYGDAVRTALDTYEQCDRRVAQLALFSTNESAEDIATAHLPYLLVPFHIAELTLKLPTAQPGPTERRAVLQRARDAYERFLHHLEGYNLLTANYARLLAAYTEDPVQFSTVGSVGGSSTGLSTTSRTGSGLAGLADPAARRNAKIANYQAEKELRGKLDVLRQRQQQRREIKRRRKLRIREAEGDDGDKTNGAEEDDDGGEEDDDEDDDEDEEEARKLYMAQIFYSVHMAFQGLDGINVEDQILAHAPVALAQFPGGETAGGLGDNRQRQGADAHSDRIDQLDAIQNTPVLRRLQSTLTGSPTWAGAVNRSGPLLTTDGKPKQPFTITSGGASNRAEMARNVFRPGHNLPTMSIDEYLEEERRRGGIIEGGGPSSGMAPEPDEDNYEKADAETLKARAWDEFTEANPRGSGNTLNRG